MTTKRSGVLARGDHRAFGCLRYTYWQASFEVRTEGGASPLWHCPDSAPSCPLEHTHTDVHTNKHTHTRQPGTQYIHTHTHRRHTVESVRDTRSISPHLAHGESRLSNAYSALNERGKREEDRERVE